MFEITYSAKQKSSGAWLPVVTINGKTHFFNEFLKKSKKGALTRARKIAESRAGILKSREV